MTVRFEELFMLCDGEYHVVNKLESILLDKLKEITRNDPNPYSGDCWVSKDISNGWYFHVSNNDRSWRVIKDNYCDFEVNTNVLSMAVSIIAFSQFVVEIDIASLQEEIMRLVKNILHEVSELLSTEELHIFHMLVD